MSIHTYISSILLILDKTSWTCIFCCPAEYLELRDFTSVDHEIYVLSAFNGCFAVNMDRQIKCVFDFCLRTYVMHAVFPRSLVYICMASRYTKMDKTSWTHSITMLAIRKEYCNHIHIPYIHICMDKTSWTHSITMLVIRKEYCNQNLK